MHSRRVCRLPAGWVTLLLATTAGAAPIRSARLPVNDLVYDPATKQIYASVVESRSLMHRGLVSIDLDSGLVKPSLATTGAPGKLAVSRQGRYLYVALNGGTSVVRFDTVNQAAGLEFTPSAGSGANVVDDLAVLPGHPESVVLSLGRTTPLPRGGVTHQGVGVFVFDNGVPRLSFALGGGSLAFQGSTNRLYGYSSDAPRLDFRRMLVDTPGVTLEDATPGLISGSGVQIQYDQGFLFTSTGRVIDPEAPLLLGTFSGLGGGAPLAADVARGRVYYLSDQGSIATLMAFDPRTFLRIGSWQIPGVVGSVSSLIRWGQERSDGGGLAFRSSSGQVFLINLGELDHHPVDFSLSTDTDPFRPLVGGRTMTVTVNLTAPAPAGGATLQLSSSNPALASVPATVTVPAGVVSASFPMPTHPVASPTDVTVTAASPDITRTLRLRFSPPDLASISVNPHDVAGDATVIVTVSLNGPAPAGGVVVQLSGIEGLPPTVTVPEGATSVSFPLAVRGRASDVYYFLFASLQGGPPGVAVMTSVHAGPAPPVPSAAVYNPANGHWYQEVRVPGTAIGWEEAMSAARRLMHEGYPGHLATVTSAAENQFIHTMLPFAHDVGLTHWLGGSGPGGVREPYAGWVWITGEPWTYASFYDDEPRTTRQGIAQLALNWDGRWLAVDGLDAANGFIVEYETAISSPPRPAPGFGLDRLMLFPNRVPGGQLAMGQVFLSEPAAPGVGVMITSSNPAVAPVQLGQGIPSGEIRTSFVINTQRVTVSTPVTITVSTPGRSVSATLVVAPEPAPLLPVSSPADVPAGPERFDAAVLPPHQLPCLEPLQ